MKDKTDLDILLERLKLLKSSIPRKNTNKFEDGQVNALNWVIEQICDLQNRPYKEIK